MDSMNPIHIELPNQRAKSPAMDPKLLVIYAFGLLIGLGTVMLTLPFSHHGTGFVPIVDALFTATSAATVTGLVTVETSTFWSLPGQLTILVMMFMGGLGIMTIATAFLVFARQRISLSQRLVMRETIGTDIFTDITTITVRIVTWAVALQLAGFIILLLRFLFLYPPQEAIWHALFQAVSGFNNAGFTSIKESQSLSAFRSDGFVLGTLAILIILGSLSYWVIADIVNKQKLSRLTLNSKLVLVTTGALLIIGAAFFYLSESRNDAILEDASHVDRVLASVFHSVNRTSGFTTIDFGRTTDQTNFFYTALMFIGGASASVAGGIKVNTFALIIISIVAALKGSQDTTAFQRRIPPHQIQWAFTMVIIALVGISALAVSLSFIEHGYPFLDLLFEAVSAIGTVGFSTGITGDLSAMGKILLTIGMFIGRVGPPMIIIAALSGQEEKSRYHYANETILVS